MLSFLHIPKTAGTALRVALSSSSIADRLLVLERDEDMFRIPYGRYKANSIIFGHLNWRAADFLGAEVRATVLREPLARCLSQVQHWFRSGQVYREPDDTCQNRWVVIPQRDFWWNFEYLIDCREMPQFRALSNAQTAQLAEHNVERPDILQDHWLSMAKEHLAQCAAVGVVNRLPRFIANFGSLLETELYIAKDNESAEQSDSLAASMPAGLREKLRRYNEMDIELYRLATEISERSDVGSVRRQFFGPHLKLGATGLQRPEGYEKLAGSLPQRLCHYLIDVADAQQRLDETGSFFLDRLMRPREAALIAMLAGEATVWTNGSAPDLALFPDLAAIGEVGADAKDHYSTANVKVPDSTSSMQPLRLAIVQGRRTAHDLESIMSQIVPAMAPLSVMVIVNAMTWTGTLNLPRIRELANGGGFVVAAVVNTHLILCGKKWEWFYKSLLRAKLGGHGVARSRNGAEEVLEVVCDY